MDRVVASARWLGDEPPALAMVAVMAVAVGYEVGSVAAGDALEPGWLVPILGLGVVVLAVLHDRVDGA